MIDFAGPYEVFQDAMWTSGAADAAMTRPFDLTLVSDSKRTFAASDGLLVTPHQSYESIPEQPNVIVMGAQGEHTPAKIAWIRKAAERADIVMSVCTGAFLLAKTGLLDGLSATTHHDFYDRFEAQFPNVRLVRGPRFVDNGKFLTAGGLTSGFEAALHVVERYLGRGAANHTAYYMEYARSPQRPAAGDAGA